MKFDCTHVEGIHDPISEWPDSIRQGAFKSFHTIDVAIGLYETETYSHGTMGAS